MKKIIKYFLINIFFILFLLLAIDEWLSFTQGQYHAWDEFFVTRDEPRYYLDRYEVKNQVLAPYDKDKKSIITVGDSYTFGWDIPQDRNFAANLQKLTNRKVYNYSYYTLGIQHIAYILNSDVFQNAVHEQEPEYMIYVFITDHLRRMYCDRFDYYRPDKYLRYKTDKNGELYLEHTNVSSLADYLKGTMIAQKINKFLFSKKSDDEKFDLLKKHLELCKNALNKKYPNAKFVIVVYHPEADTHNLQPFYTKRWKELEAEGFIVLKFDKDKYKYLADRKNMIWDGGHPKPEVWERLTPVIVKKLNL